MKADCSPAAVAGGRAATSPGRLFFRAFLAPTAAAPPLAVPSEKTYGGTAPPPPLLLLLLLLELELLLLLLAPPFGAKSREPSPPKLDSPASPPKSKDVASG